VVTLERIKAAIKKSVDSLISKMSENSNRANLIVFCQADIFCNMMSGPAIKANNILETLLLDKNRLINFWKGMRYMATILSICNHLKHDSAANISATEFAKLIDPVISHIVLESTDKSLVYKFDYAKKDSLCDCIAHAFQLREVEKRDAVINSVKSAFNSDNAVTSLM